MFGRVGLRILEKTATGKIFADTYFFARFPQSRGMESLDSLT
jgi:hypothetical protein